MGQSWHRILLGSAPPNMNPAPPKINPDYAHGHSLLGSPADCRSGGTPAYISEVGAGEFPRGFCPPRVGTLLALTLLSLRGPPPNPPQGAASFHSEAASQGEEAPHLSTSLTTSDSEYKSVSTGLSNFWVCAFVADGTAKCRSFWSLFSCVMGNVQLWARDCAPG